MTLVIQNNYFIFVFAGLMSCLFLSWGSFLNVVAYRLLYSVNFFAPRSQCPHCTAIIAWYDLIPVISWFVLHGRCRTCKEPISWLYSLIELITLLSFWGIILTQPLNFWVSYGLFFSALIITIRTDVEDMIILRPFSLGIIPLGFFVSFFGYLPITLHESSIGALMGFFILWLVRKLSYVITGTYGMGNGDPELLAAIGAFAGPFGCWITLLIGSFLGSIVGAFFMLRYGAYARKMPIPFGPFLAIGAILTVIFTSYIAVIMQYLQF